MEETGMRIPADIHAATRSECPASLKIVAGCAADHQPAGDAAAGAGRLQPAKDGALQQGAVCSSEHAASASSGLSATAHFCTYAVHCLR